MKFLKVGKQMLEDRKIPFGIQLYSVREEFSQETLKALAEIGYKTVEFAGYNDIPALTMASYLQQLGLKAPSSHIPLHRLEQDLEDELKYAKHFFVTTDKVFFPMDKEKLLVKR
jgi:sugar phosphate isomerase/epimerase